MNFKEAMNILSGAIDYYYNEFYGTTDTNEEYETYKEMERAEDVFALLVKTLKDNGIETLDQLKNFFERMNKINKELKDISSVIKEIKVGLGIIE